MNRKDLDIPAFFTTDGNDVWKLRWYSLEPMCELENMETHKTQEFAMGGLTARKFKHINLPEVKAYGG